jgi:hypothetical protein
MSCTGVGRLQLSKNILLFRIHDNSFHPTSLLEDVATAWSNASGPKWWWSNSDGMEQVGLDDSQKQRQSLQSFYAQECRSRILGRTISLRLLGLILRVLILEVSVWIYLTTGKRVWFSISFSSFFFYNVSVQWLNCKNYKRLREFEVI